MLGSFSDAVDADADRGRGRIRRAHRDVAAVAEALGRSDDAAARVSRGDWCVALRVSAGAASEDWAGCSRLVLRNAQ